MNNFIFSSLQRYNKSTYFSIHDLCPDFIDEYPQFCTNQPFNLFTIEPILDNLNKHLNSCTGKSSIFWKHKNTVRTLTLLLLNLIILIIY